MNVLFLVADNMAPLQAKIDRWKASVGKQGAIVAQMTLPTSMSVPDVANVIRSSQPDAVQIVGHIAVPMVWDGVDGHGYRPGSKDLFYGVDPSSVFVTHPDGSYEITFNAPQVRAVGRADFFGLPFGDELALTEAWLDSNDAYRTGEFQYDNASILNCTLDYLDPNIGSNLITVMEAVTGAGSVFDARSKYPFKQFYQTYAGKKYFCASMYDGGEPFFIGEYNTGSAADFASGLVAMAVMLLFCSNGWHPDDWYLQRAALVGGSQAVTYGTWTPPSLSTWSPTVPIGQAVIQGGGQYTICGDVMLPKLEDDELSQAQIDTINARFTADEARIQALEDAVKANPLPPPGPIVVLSAHYRQVANPTVFVDVTSQVQTLVNAGRPWSVHPGLADPYPNILKELWVSWTDSGVAHTQVFSQLQPVVL